MKHGNIDEQINVKTTITCVTLCRIMLGGAAIAALFMWSVRDFSKAISINLSKA